MKERRPLIAGLPTSDDEKSIEKSFVFGSGFSSTGTEQHKTPPTSSATQNVSDPAPNYGSILPQITSRVPVTARCRPEVASAIKRASLQRQLEGIQPYHVQGIMEEALDAWLTDNGYL